MSRSQRRLFRTKKGKDICAKRKKSEIRYSESLVITKTLVISKSNYTQVMHIDWTKFSYSKMISLVLWATEPKTILFCAGVENGDGILPSPFVLFEGRKKKLVFLQLQPFRQEGCFPSNTCRTEGIDLPLVQLRLTFFMWLDSLLELR